MKKELFIVLCLTASTNTLPANPTLVHFLCALGTTVAGLASFPREATTIVNRFLMFPQAEIGQLSALPPLLPLQIKTALSTIVSAIGIAHTTFALHHLNQQSTAATKNVLTHLSNATKQNETQNI